MTGGRRPLLRENSADTDLPLAKRRFSIYFRLYRLSRNTKLSDFGTIAQCMDELY